MGASWGEGWGSTFLPMVVSWLTRFHRPRAARTEDFGDTIVKDSGANRQVEHGKAAPDAVGLPETLAQSHTRNADLLRLGRRTGGFQHSPEVCERNELLAQTRLELRPRTAQLPQLFAQGFSAGRFRED